MSELPAPGTPITKGQLDGLIVSPLVDDAGKLKSLMFTIKDLPGLRIIVEADACRELQTVLNIMFPL